EACNMAIDERDYDTALSACTSRKDLASAWMGKAGYDIVNLIKASSSAPSAFTEPSGVSLGTDDITGAAILNILQLSTHVIYNYKKRANKIRDSKNYLYNASGLLHPYLRDNSSPLSMDEILLDTYAIAFAMQLNQIILYDNGTTGDNMTPSGTPDNLTCTNVTGDNGTEAKEKLKAMDGHLWSSEMVGVQCNSIISAINPDQWGTDNFSDLIDNLSNRGNNGGLLPISIRKTICDPIESLSDYILKLVDNIETIGEKMNLSGDNTKAITNAQSSTDNLTKAIGCRE
ncbi:MAG: hypothetical protein MK434_09545, partial [SAR324 cluster bacterium]|nr:hypothetical protein [SAR324 cluster bacterium]